MGMGPLVGVLAIVIMALAWEGLKGVIERASRLGTCNDNDEAHVRHPECLEFRPF